MLLETVNIAELAELLRPHMGRCAWPGLDESATRTRARRLAKRSGAWDALGHMLSGDKAIPVLRRSVYRCYQREGIRHPEEAAFRERMVRTDAARAAVWLKHPAADVDYLQDLLWAWCDQWTWTIAAHESAQALDLRATMTAMVLAETVAVLRDRLEEEVVERVKADLWRRILLPAADPREPKWWATCRNNWNHVCNANLIGTALNVMDDHLTLAAYIHPLIQRMDYALQGFAADGGCLEGPTYWNFGFGHYLEAAVMLHQRTGGELNLMADARAARIARYPLAAYLGGGHCTTFADAHDGPFTTENVLKVNHLVKLPQLYACARLDGKGRLKMEGPGGWHGAMWRGLALYRGNEKPPKGFTLPDVLLADMGQVKTHAGARSDAVLAAIAGHNGVNHNHNDVGSFIFRRGGRALLTDPGAPVYNAKTFSARRYEMLFCRSRGHSVPVVNGREQSVGEESRGTLAAQGLNGEGTKTVRIEMGGAYGDRTLTSLTRTLVLEGRGRLTIEDAYRFSRKPRSVEEAFVTYEQAQVQRGGRSVRIGRGRGSAALRAVSPGRFKVDRLVEESKEGRGAGVVTRITFAPRDLGRQMVLRFEI